MYIYIFHVLGPLALFVYWYSEKPEKKKTCRRNILSVTIQPQTNRILLFTYISMSLELENQNKRKRRKKHSRDK